MTRIEHATRAQLDAYALESHVRAAAANRAGAFRREIVPPAVPGAQGDVLHETDEGIVEAL